jgi:hypothetical protein
MRFPGSRDNHFGNFRSTPVRWSTSNPLTVWMIVALLSIIALMLILPDDVDLPDTAFHRNSSAQAIRNLSQRALQSNAHLGLFRLPFQSVSSSALHSLLGETGTSHPEERSVEHEILRC